jgi:hypothetical protein
VIVLPLRDALIWYLAVFRRLFVRMDAAATDEDREAMWVCQWAADALHNVPSLLRRYEDRSQHYAWYTPADAERQLLAFPEFISEIGGPEPGVALARELVSQQGAAAELGLAPDLRDLDLAPELELHGLLDLLFRLSIGMRQRTPRAILAEGCWAYCEFQGRNNAILARLAKELPVGLVHWRQFDAAAFRERIELANTELARWRRA